MTVHPRVEYLDFHDVADQREFRFRISGPDGAAEIRFAIANAAIAAGRIRLQDGPDVCYQKALRLIAGGETAAATVVAIDEADLESYREAHTHVAKQRARPRTATPAPPRPPRAPFVPRAPLRPSPQPLAVPLASPAVPDLDEGRRVRHAIFGAGVTTTASAGHTAIRFDEGGTKTFVTSMLEVDVLSAPHTWEAARRGPNRPRRDVAPSAAVSADAVAPDASSAAGLTAAPGDEVS